MAAALIVLDQPSHSSTPNGVAGVARDDLEISKLVQLSNDNDLGVRQHFWEITDQPDIGSPVSLSNPIAPSPTFTPVAAGTYRIALRVNEGRVGEIAVTLAVIREADGTRYPAAGEQDEANWDDPATSAPNKRGWWQAIKDKVAAAAALLVKEDGADLVTITTEMDFLGTGVTAVGTGPNAVSITVPALDVEDEGSSVEAVVNQLNFAGAGVMAAPDGANKVTVTIPGGGGGSMLDVEDENASVESDTQILNFLGAGVDAVSAGGNQVDVTIPGIVGVGGNAPAYTGYDDGSLTWASTTWADITGIATNWNDVVQDGITRSGSDYTFAAAGRYQACITMAYAATAGRIGVRLNGDTGGILGSSNLSDNTNERGQLTLNVVIDVVAGEVVAIEYAVTVGFIIVSAVTLDSHALRGVIVSFVKIEAHGGSGELAFTGLKTANYTAVAGELVKYDPTGGTFTLDFPASPAADDVVSFKNASASVTAVTLDGNGETVEDPGTYGVAATQSVSGDGLTLAYQFDGTSWLVRGR